MSLFAGIIRVIAAFTLLYACVFSSTKKIYIFNGIYNFLLGVQYYLLNAIAGAISSFAAILRNIIFHKHSGPSSMWALILYLIVVAVINIPA